MSAQGLQNLEAREPLVVAGHERPRRELGAGVRHHVVDRGLDANMKAAETKLMRSLKTNVKIVPGKKGASGKIEIEYYSIDDLDRIYELIVKQ